MAPSTLVAASPGVPIWPRGSPAYANALWHSLQKPSFTLQFFTTALARPLAQNVRHCDRDKTCYETCLWLSQAINCKQTQYLENEAITKYQLIYKRTCQFLLCRQDVAYDRFDILWPSIGEQQQRDWYCAPPPLYCHYYLLIVESNFIHFFILS